MTARHITLENHEKSGADAGLRGSPTPRPRRYFGWAIPISLAALVLLCLSFGFFWAWDPDSPPSHSVAGEIAKEKTLGAAPHSLAPSSTARGSAKLAKGVVVAAPEGGDQPGEPQAKVSPTPVLSEPSSIGQTRIDSSDLTVPDEWQTERLSISGRVLDETGYPLPGIVVQATVKALFNADEEVTDPTHEAVQEVFTGYDGAFVFQGLADGEYRIYTTTIDAFAPAHITVRAGVTSANLILVAQREIQVYGVVESTDGTPLEAVQVIHNGQTPGRTETGPQGHYELAMSLKTNDQFLPLYFKREGYRDQPMRLDPADLDGEFDDILLDILMEPVGDLATVTGSLRDLDGHSVVGEVIRLKSSKLKTIYRGQSDRNGHFSFEGVEPGTDYTVRVTPINNYKDYARRVLEIPGSGSKLEVLLEPLQLGRVSGWMIDVDGDSIPGFTLSLRSRVAHRHSVLVTSDEDGYFEMEGVPEGGVELSTASLPKFMVTGIRASSEDVDSVFVVLDLGSQELLGRVTDRSGKPLAAPNVILAWWYKEKGVRSFSARRTSADANGAFTFTGLGPGPHTLRVSAPGYSSTKIELDVGLDPKAITVQLDEEM